MDGRETLARAAGLPAWQAPAPASGERSWPVLISRIFLAVFLLPFPTVTQKSTEGVGLVFEKRSRLSPGNVTEPRPRAAPRPQASAPPPPAPGGLGGAGLRGGRASFLFVLFLVVSGKLPAVTKSSRLLRASEERKNLKNVPIWPVTSKASSRATSRARSRREGSEPSLSFYRFPPLSP